jgi:RimJ/RimL family protein N-acetyltransferase
LAEFQHLTRPDHSLTWITHPDDDPGRIIATVNLVRTTDPDTAELGIMIEDGWQSRGLGTSLARYARTRARTLGCTSMVAVTGSTNVRMLKIMRTLGALPWTITGTTVDVTVPVA